MPSNLRSEYLAELAALGRSNTTIDTSAYALGQCEEWRGQPIEDLTRIEARTFTRHLTHTYKPSRVDSRLKALRAENVGASQRGIDRWRPLRCRPM